MNWVCQNLKVKNKFKSHMLCRQVDKAEGRN